MGKAYRDPVEDQKMSIYVSDDVELGEGVKIFRLVNLYGCKIGDRTKIGTFVEIQRGVVIGKDCKISSHTFVCTGVEIGDGVFIGHGVVFVNDNHPRAVTDSGAQETDSDWADRFVTTKVCDGAVIGSNATILGGLTIGEGAIVGAGAVVVKDVEPHTIVVGIPAMAIKK